MHSAAQKQLFGCEQGWKVRQDPLSTSCGVVKQYQSLTWQILGCVKKPNDPSVGHLMGVVWSTFTWRWRGQM